MSAGSSLVERASEMTFTSDAPTARRLRTLVEALALPADNVAVRWAMCRSMVEGPIGTPPSHDGGGKELKGKTLFGATDLATLLLAQLVLVEGHGAVEADLRGIVLGHWSRGQALLADELERFGGSGEALILREIERRTLTTRIADFDSQIIGQPGIVEGFERLHEAAWRSGSRRLDGPVVVVGPPGSGRTFLAELLAHSLSDTIVKVTASRGMAFGDLRDRVAEAAQGHVPPVLLVEDLHLLPPRTKGGLLRLVDEASVIATSTDSASGAWTTCSITPYERDAVAQIVRRKFGWHLEVRRLVALAGRLRPAPALERADELAQIAGVPIIGETEAAAAFERWGLDRLGLDQRDLLVLEQLAQGGPNAVDRLVDVLEVDEATIVEQVLPYLEQLGLAVASKPGRWGLTPIGAETYGN